MEPIAEPLHIQHLKTSLDLRYFLSCVQEAFENAHKECSDSESDVLLEFSKTARKLSYDRARLFNFENVGTEREWLQKLLVCDTSSSSDDEPMDDTKLKTMLKMHIKEKKIRSKYYSTTENSQYKYYGSGLLSNYDRFLEHQNSIVCKKRKRNKNNYGNSRKIRKSLENSVSDKKVVTSARSAYTKLSCNDRIQDQTLLPNVKMKSISDNTAYTLRWNKIYSLCLREIGKRQRAKINNHKDILAGCKRLAYACMKVNRPKAIKSQKNMKDKLWKIKHVAKDIQNYWKRYGRVEKETMRRLKKEAEEQRRFNGELMEAKRQQRKLNFLITQAELYAHFMCKKRGESIDEESKILNHLDEDTIPSLSDIDHYDSEEMKLKALRNVHNVVQAEKARTHEFCASYNVLQDSEHNATTEWPQPTIFLGNLKQFQLKGMNWLISLYDQGINGILADEMGLGKTIQSIAFLCHLAENYDVWGPFIIISTTSTLHNWEQEINRFVPSFNIGLYSGGPQDRKRLRRLWNQKDLQIEGVKLNVVITSYQLVIRDFKYFNQIKWHYLILDEAQALKSTNSVRWKLLKRISCRNRLLLSGTPVQNNMAELWALLHVIMPSLFDSHDEFNEWFSKAIEDSVENKTGVDGKHLSRLHLILKPFILRRTKKDVMTELTDKIEEMIYCPLTPRQTILYNVLKDKISIDDLLHNSCEISTTGNETGNIMNVIMQLRKVCNHPDLFECRDVKSPYFLKTDEYIVPKLIFNFSLIMKYPLRKYILYNLLNIFHSDHIHYSLFPKSESSVTLNSIFSFIRFFDMTSSELCKITLGGLLREILHCQDSKVAHDLALFRTQGELGSNTTHRLFLIECLLPFSRPSIKYRPILKNLIFTAMLETENMTYCHTEQAFYYTEETVSYNSYRKYRNYAKQPKKFSQIKDLSTSVEYYKKNYSDCLFSSNKHYQRHPFKVMKDEPTQMPSFLLCYCPKASATPRIIFCSSCTAVWYWSDHYSCSCPDGYNTVWYGLPELVSTSPKEIGGLEAARPCNGWSKIFMPDKDSLITDSGKLCVLDILLKRLKEQGHRVLIYSQMTKMINLLEEFMWYKKYTYIRLDGSSKISERRDMIANFQSREDIFIFLLSTRAGGLGINLTAADTVIFYDSDWNPTVDEQAMDRTHRLGQTKQVTVYRLICKDTVEEKILEKAKKKSEIQKMVISEGNFKPDPVKPKEAVSLLLRTEEIQNKCQQQQLERQMKEEIHKKSFRNKKVKKKTNFGVTFDTFVINKLDVSKVTD